MYYKTCLFDTLAFINPGNCFFNVLEQNIPRHINPYYKANSK